MRRFAVLSLALGLLVVGCTTTPPAPNTATVVVNGQTVTVTGPTGSTVRVQSVDRSTLPPTPTGITSSIGPLHVDIGGVPAGSVALVTVRFPRQVSGVLKLIGGMWDRFPFDGTTGATVAADNYTVTLRLQDGGRGDTDGLADGRILDPIEEIDWNPPPSLDLPGLNWRRPAPVVVAPPQAPATATWTATAVDEIDGDIPVSCVPSSGSEFAYGVTPVECTATDSSGNVSTGNFTVTVQQAPTAVDAGADNTCAVLVDHTARCWGWNYFGQLGNGVVSQREEAPVQVEGLSDIRSISAGDEHTCAIVGDGGAVYCWGRNQAGQLGDGTTDDSLTPVAVAGLGPALSVAAGRDQTCAILTDGTGRCWGVLPGTFPDTNSPTPVVVDGVSGAVSVTIGVSNPCALLADQTVRCWGSSVGSLPTPPPMTAVPVPGLAGVVSLDAGTFHTCAALSIGTAFCWGSNGSGEVGDGTSGNFAWEPVQVTGLTGAVEVTAGNDHSCARLADGTIRCWGENRFGQLGDGSFTDSSLPVPAGLVDFDTDPPSPLSDATHIVAGGNRTCAIRANGLMGCWGNPPLGTASTVPVAGVVWVVNPLT